MKSVLFSLFLPLIACTGLAFAAELVTVHPTVIITPQGTDSGSLVMAGNQMVFVDNTNPSNSFCIPRSQISSSTLSNGAVTLSLSQPFTSPLSSGDTVVVQPTDGSAGSVASWAGLSANSTTPALNGEANRSVTSPASETYDYPVTYHGHEGMLRIGDTTVAFDAQNPKHSMAWNYDVLKKIQSKPNKDEVRLVLHGGDTLMFKLAPGQAFSQEALNLVSQRIAAAPPVR